MNYIFFSRDFNMTLFLAILISMACLFMTGCTTAGVGQSRLDSESVDRVYHVTAQEALVLAREAMSKELTDQKILPLKKPRLGLLVHQSHQPGYAKYARFRETNYIYELDLFAMEGETPQGKRIAGYTFTIIGNGDLKNGSEKVTQIDQRLKDVFGEKGRPVDVVSAHPIEHGTAKKTIVPKAAPAAPPADGDTFVKLKKLKELLDQGIITKEEFQIKKKELLKRI